ncbi:transmembrane protein-like [Tropilaelaps mercedesae]|uniref:Transmembrane protein-like n=1 Tax=Tropilaelaps mercedesae TaxID=418985 RepID=A0A1V9XL69_9ACAR|nr:transmembrane protein-like [Tropilaelaps mercedesae]
MAAPLDATARLDKLACDLRTLHQEYVDKLQPAYVASIGQQKAIQRSEEFCEKQVRHLLHNLVPLRLQLARLKPSEATQMHEQERDPCIINAVNKLDSSAAELEGAIKLIKRNLPAPSGKYLYLVLGSVRVSMPNNRLKLNYKIEYENFKLVVTWALLALSVICLCRGPGTRWDPVLMFGLVWFHCTLTIRESILKANGSNIKGWWRMYHFLATGLSGVTVLWADKEGFQVQLRSCFLAYTCVMLIAHQMQYRYQAGMLYRLQALGGNAKVNPMEVTVEGVRSLLAGPMYRDFFLLMPFLYAVYLLQLAMLYLIVELINSKPELATWHAVSAAVLFGVMFVGNVLTTTAAIYSKSRTFLPDPLHLFRKFH